MYLIRPFMYRSWESECYINEQMIEVKLGAPRVTLSFEGFWHILCLGFLSICLSLCVVGRNWGTWRSPVPTDVGLRLQVPVCLLPGTTIDNEKRENFSSCSAVYVILSRCSKALRNERLSWALCTELTKALPEREEGFTVPGPSLLLSKYGCPKNLPLPLGWSEVCELLASDRVGCSGSFWMSNAFLDSTCKNPKSHNADAIAESVC